MHNPEPNFGLEAETKGWLAITSHHLVTTEILHQPDLLPDNPPWNQFRANSSSQLKLTEMVDQQMD